MGCSGRGDFTSTHMPLARIWSPGPNLSAGDTGKCVLPVHPSRNNEMGLGRHMLPFCFNSYLFYYENASIFK